MRSGRTWEAVITDALRGLGSSAHLKAIAEAVKDEPKARGNNHVAAKVRQVVRRSGWIRPVEGKSGHYELLAVKCTCPGQLCVRDGLFFDCGTCGREVPYCFGAADAHPDDCDDCAAKKTEAEETRTLQSEQNTPGVEKLVMRAAREHFGRKVAAVSRPAFEHGQWWLLVDEHKMRDFGDEGTRTFSVVDASPGIGTTGLDFEEVG